ncbi:hypothetical protein ACIF8T_38435 [Streptomyces sp. NPDC085946]|uniref:hypothetical protein n=1 Tax=Streptomyces sp. NPDC085946 TaxID=3365744 RepID=UPI0037D5DF98
MRHVLRLAGYDLVREADGETPGIRVSRIPVGALVSWTPLSSPSAPAGTAQAVSESTGSAVQAALEIVLLQHGYTIWTDPAGNNIVVLSPSQSPPLPLLREMPDE